MPTGGMACAGPATGDVVAGSVVEVEDEDALTFCPILVDPALFVMLGTDTSTEIGIETGVDPEAWTGNEARTARGVISSRVCAWACICPVP